MSTTGLSGKALERRLHELLGEERNVQVEFLIHLEEFDRRRGWEASGVPTLWEYCRKVLGLLDGAVFRRTTAMRILREHPRVEAFLRDGRLFMTTLVLLRDVLTAENATELFVRASGKSKKDVEYLVASLRPRKAPVIGVRKLPIRSLTLALPSASEIAGNYPHKSDKAVRESSPDSPIDHAADPPPLIAPCPVPAPRPRAEMHPVSAERWAITLVVNAEFRELFEKAKTILGHVVPDGDPVTVVRRALEEIVRKDEQRHAAKESRIAARADSSEERTREGDEEAPGSTGAGAEAERSEKRTTREAIPAKVRRDVWNRDDGRCRWPMPGGGVCGSTKRLELDHVVPHALGGKTETANLRLLCRDHNQRSAREAFGEKFMGKFGKKSLPLEEVTGNPTAWRRGP